MYIAMLDDTITGIRYLCDVGCSTSNWRFLSILNKAHMFNNIDELKSVVNTLRPHPLSGKLPPVIVKEIKLITIETL